ncbi:hypothetical protein [Stenotrophomonas sp.]|uniref:hypothetical protein n=1 Tax=Stenotrophomonas sp. TaxID=69392 RepID=UPI0028977B3E|nr:hypothetical protein [Stenotrophomonas sp.]
MGHFDSDHFHRLVALLNRSGGVGECLPYPDMTPVPAGFDEFAHRDSQSELDWSDVCPAYALALVTAGSYALPQHESDMEVLWDELGGNSTRLWSDVREIVKRAWAWLDAHHVASATQR